MAGGRLVKASKPTVVTIKKRPSKLQKVVRDVNQLKKKQKKVEWKYSSNAFAAPITAQQVSTTPFIKLLNDPADNIAPATAANGNGFDKYSGQQYTMQSIQIDGYLRGPVGSTGYDNIRIVLVKYKSPDGVGPTYATVPNQVFADGTPYSFRALTNRNDFVILKEWNIQFDTLTTNGLSNNRRIKLFKKLNGMTCTLNATPAIEENALYLMAVGTVAAGAGSPLLSLNVRIRFTDE